MANINPFRYRDYYYDTEPGFYYLNSRYYDPETGRFINPDGVIAKGSSPLLYNLFIYCKNNPVMLSDPNGHSPVPASVYFAGMSGYSMGEYLRVEREYNQYLAQSENRRPNTGEPGSTYKAPNGDTRTYGPNRRPSLDYDHDDHGQPNKHPHDENGGHYHDWDWTKDPPRQPARTFSWEPVLGGVLATACVIGAIVVVADDITGIGIADNGLLGPLGTGISQGLIMIFG